MTALQEFARALITEVGQADLLLLGLVVLFFVSGLAYRMSVERQCSAIRADLAKVKRSVEEVSVKEKAAREELQRLLNAQNANMLRINKLKIMKTQAARKPMLLDKELGELIAWCNQKNIFVDVKRRQASRRVAPPGRRI